MATIKRRAPFRALVLSSILFLWLTGAGTVLQHAVAEERALTVYTALMEPEAMVYARAFENRTGIKVGIVRKSTGVMLSLLRLEKDHPVADVLFGGPADAYVLGAAEGLFEQYKSYGRSGIPATYMDQHGFWTGVYLGSIGFAVNSCRLRALGVSPPTSWRELLSPRLRGEISMANPVSSGTGYTVLATLAQLMGEERAFDYLKTLDANVAAYTSSGAMPGKLVGLGQVAVGILFSHDILAFRQQGYDIDLIFPAEGTGFEIGGIAIVKGTRRLDEARTFVDFMVGVDGQNLYAAMGEFRIPTNRLAVIPRGAVPFSRINVIDYDVTWAALHKQALLDRWNSIAGGRGGE
ncbi:MAG: ABC transporter substrate-binding protein [Bacillota bacterium]